MPHDPRTQRRLRIARLVLSRQACRVFVYPLAESSTNPRSQAYARLAESVAEVIGRGQGIFPALLAVALEEIDLIWSRRK